MGYSDRSRAGINTTFSQLDGWIKKFIADRIAIELFLQLNRKISSEILMAIFEKFDVDVEISPDETYSILKNEKLEVAVKNISARF